MASTSSVRAFSPVVVCAKGGDLIPPRLEGQVDQVQRLEEVQGGGERRLGRGQLPPALVLLDKEVRELLVLGVPRGEDLGYGSVEGRELQRRAKSGQ